MRFFVAHLVAHQKTRQNPNKTLVNRQLEVKIELFIAFGILYATFMLTLNKGTDIHLLAKQIGTSTEMIERHYSHLIARMRSVDLAGKEHGVYEGLV